MRRVVAVLSLFTALTSSAAEIYCNAQGRECSDRPTASANIARVLGGNTTISRARSIDAGGAAQSSSADGDAADSGIKADPVAEQQRRNAAQDAANKALQKDLAGARSEQCRKAQEYYKQSLEAASIFRVDKDGKKVFLSEAEANQSRLNAKMEIDRTCGKGGG
jgi:hypothetical protein